MAITYEWVAEPVDKHGDIIDPLFDDTLAKVKEWKAEDFDGCVRIEYALVRNDGNDEEGLQERQYAYTHDGFKFDHGAKVPKRFIKEAGLGL